MTSHAAVVARGMGTCCVAGCGELTISEENKSLSCGSLVLREGDLISVDGYSGRIYRGELPTVLVENNQDLQRLLAWADEVALPSSSSQCRNCQRLDDRYEFWGQRSRTGPVRNTCSLDKNGFSKCVASS